MSFNLHNNHQLITREQNYSLNRSIISIHSEDRDLSCWPNSNEFEIILPDSYDNVQSIRLVQSMFPTKLFVFSNSYHNTKLKFIDENSSASSASSGGAGSTELSLTNTKTYHIITIDEGTYTPDELAFELSNKMATKSPGINYKILYNKVTNKFVFSSNRPFTLIFDEYYSEYNNISNCNNSSIFNQHTNWGLGYYLGFDKKQYEATNNGSDIEFNYLEIKTPTNNTIFITSPKCINILGDNTIYMEIDKYNSYDELYPYNDNNSSYNNKYGGKTHSAFAKIIVNNDFDTNYTFKNVLGYKTNLGFTSFDPPLERLSKFKFKFRFHDSRPVDFQNQPFNFSLEINYLTNEINKFYTIRKPELL